jgi:large conductance mechanosensitive channel
MTGLKNFIMRGNLVELAVAFVIATAFATVVTAMVAVFMDLVGKVGGIPDFSAWSPGGVSIGAFLTALIAFVVLATVVYFMVVKPYEVAKRRFAADPEVGPTELQLLAEIRDAIRDRRTSGL